MGECSKIEVVNFVGILIFLTFIIQRVKNEFNKANINIFSCLFFNDILY